MNRLRTGCACLFAIVLSTSSVAATPPEPPPPQVSANGKLSVHSSAEGDVVPFTFTFTFRGAASATLSDLRIVNLPAGYKLRNICVDSPQSCMSPNQLDASKNLIASTISSGRSLVVWGDLEAGPPHKPQTLFLVLHWQIQPRVYSSLAVDLGENEVQSRFWVRFSDYLPILVLPFAIPLVLGIFTFLFNLLAGRDTRRTEIWKQMLPASHGYSTKFYSPMSSASDALAGELSDSHLEVAFFFFLLLLRINLDTTLEIGGLYFKDHRGEALASECWLKIWLVFFDAGRKSPFYLSAYGAARIVDPQSTYNEFSRRYLVQSGKKITFANSDMQQCWSLFGDVIPKDPKNFERLILLLQGFSTTLDYEVNRPYKYWYTAVVPVRIRKKVLELLRQIAKERGIRGVKRFRYFWGWKTQD